MFQPFDIMFHFNGEWQPLYQGREPIYAYEFAKDAEPLVGDFLRIIWLC